MHTGTPRGVSRVPCPRVPRRGSTAMADARSTARPAVSRGRSRHDRTMLPSYISLEGRTSCLHPSA